MSTRIWITPPGAEPTEIKVYERCSVTFATTSRAGSFSLQLPTKNAGDLIKYPIGSDVRILQDNSLFRGWVLNPPRSVDGKKNVLELTGMCYTAKTQKIIVAESYANTAISDIVIDLFTKYAPEYSLESIMPCDKIISIKFADVYLFDAMETLCKLAGYEWFIDEPLPEAVPLLDAANGWSELVDIVPSIAYSEDRGWAESVAFIPPTSLWEQQGWIEETFLVALQAVHPDTDLYPSENLFPA